MNKNILWSSGIFAALFSSLCCITPVLAFIAGASGLASSFSWLDPLRPYLIGISVLVLGFAWFQKLKPKTETDADCACDPVGVARVEQNKPSFWQSKKFLGMITVFAVLMMTFPLYAHIFYVKKEPEVMMVSGSDVEKVTFEITGMTCSGCSEHVVHEVKQLDGIVRASASYEQGNAIVEFDKSKTNVGKIEETINSTGYTVTKKSVQ